MLQIWITPYPEQLHQFLLFIGENCVVLFTHAKAILVTLFTYALRIPYLL